MTILELDKKRCPGKLPSFQYFYRKAQMSKIPLVRIFYRKLFEFTSKCRGIEFSINNVIGYGLYIGHPYGITINKDSIIGNNVNIHKGVTIGQENRGKRKGVPHIGNCVWLGINCTIVGNIRIGDDVLIAPNTYVNCDIPDHSIVFGNPCIIKKVDWATKEYICNAIEI